MCLKIGYHGYPHPNSPLKSIDPPVIQHFFAPKSAIYRSNRRIWVFSHGPPESLVDLRLACGPVPVW